MIWLITGIFIGIFLFVGALVGLSFLFIAAEAEEDKRKL